MPRARGILCAVLLLTAVLHPSAALRADQAADDALIKKARAIHEKVITLDTHVDIEPNDFTAERNYAQRLDSQVDLPKMTEGGLDAVFMIVYVGQPSLQTTPMRSSRAATSAPTRPRSRNSTPIHRLTEKIAPDKIQLALTAADVRRIQASGKKVALIGVENGYPIGDDLAPREGVLRSRRPLHVARAQRPQPALRLEHRRSATAGSGTACRRSASRSSRR